MFHELTIFFASVKSIGHPTTFLKTGDEVVLM